MMLSEYYLHHKIITVVTVMILPYMFILPINNYIAVHYGFYPISDNVVFMLLVAFLFIFLGSVLSSILGGKPEQRVSIEADAVEKFPMYHMDLMKWYVIAVEIILLIKLFYILYAHGFAYLADDAAESNFISGIAGHLFLTIYPLIPILFYYWLKNKRQILFLFLSFMGLIFAFLSFTKYHSIGLIILIYLFVALEDRKYVKKGALALVIAAVGIFVINYVLGFFSRNVLGNVSGDFYLMHLWKYIGGSCIHDNTIFTSGQNIGVGYGYKLLYCVFPFINMILIGAFGTGLDIPVKIPFDVVADNGETTNVLDFIGFMFPSEGGAGNYLAFAVIMIMFGLILSYIYNVQARKRQLFSVLACIIMTFFCFLSFFGIFASRSMIWELMLWSVIMPMIFDGRICFDRRKSWGRYKQDAIESRQERLENV